MVEVTQTDEVISRFDMACPGSGHNGTASNSPAIEAAPIDFVRASTTSVSVKGEGNLNIKELLEEFYAYHRDNDPEGTIGFYPSATAAEIDRAAAAFPVPFPEELRELYSLYGMVFYIWDTIDILGVAEMPAHHQQLLEISDDYGEVENTKGPVAPVAHTSMRIPFAGNADLNYSMDLDPRTGGTRGQIVRLDLELGELEVVADSLRDFLAQGLEQLRSEERR